ncbi:MAG TPA: DNA polymerase/3'-5' exonuclease PolX [Thermoanaerobaculia bacterium]|nr:DNA polymerase/3'-5' exonuclease PolX [Thermoanaerobaculia bacterium]
MNRQAVSRILKETGILLEIRGENPFRVRAYENAARAIEGMADEPEDRLEAGTLGEIPGIGPGLVASIGEILHTGRLALNEELRAEVPPGLLQLYRIPGLGAKRIRALHEKLGVGSPAELEAACREGSVAALAGFGAKSEQKILEGLARLGERSERHLISEAEPEAARLLEHLEGHAGVRRVSIAGSLRRRSETIGDLDFVAAVDDDDRGAVASRFESAPGIEEVIASGETKVSIRLGSGFQADLRMVSDDEFASALHHFTGSKEHNVELRGLARRRGLTINEYGLFEGEERIPVAAEEELYERLGLAWVPPEMREGAGEVRPAESGPPPRLIEEGDLRGTLHVHTTWSDGIATLEQMARAAAALGWEYLGIADHSRSAAYAGGLTPERVREQWREIDAWNERDEPPFLFKGTECDILQDGSLDFPDELLLGFDFVVVSVHSRFGMPREAMTARIARAVSHPCATFLGHPTGRLLLAREGYELDLDDVLSAARENGTVPEINANPHRLDLDWRVLRGWLAAGGRTSIHPDAHSTQGLADVRYGVGVARKAGARAEDVLVTLPLEELRERFRARRERARKLLGGVGASG